MGIVHIPRTAAAVAKGLIKRYQSPLPEQAKSLIGIGSKNPPHIYSSRAGLFDVDLMFHMNNASYLTHAELARWEWTAFGGTLAANLKTKSYFIVTASMIRWRREIAPFQKFEIETRLGAVDDRNLWIYQTFHHSKDEERGKVMAQVFTQGVVTKGRKVINPRAWIEENVPAAKDAIDDLSSTSDEITSLFDEKSSRFIHLEDALRRTAALHDDKVAK